jgi:hypothetical protein
MIRIYLDWNVVSNFKRDEYFEIRNFIAEHKDCLLIPFTPAHFDDLMKSYNSDNVAFYQDLEHLEYLSEKHFLRWENDIKISFITPKEYFEKVKNNDDVSSMIDFEKIFHDLDSLNPQLNIGTLMKSILELSPSEIQVTDKNREWINKLFPNITNDSSALDAINDVSYFMKKLSQDRNYYKNLRKDIADEGFKLDANSGNWIVENVIENIDNTFRDIGIPYTFFEFVNKCLENNKETVNIYNYYINSYLMLDLFGFKPDKLPKPTNNMQNILTDGNHSFFSAFCDYFVTTDEKLKIKTQVLYNKFNVSTVIITPKEFIETLKSKIHNLNINTNFLWELSTILDFKNGLEKSHIYEENDIHVFKLPLFYLNFFNYVTVQFSHEKNCIQQIIFERVFKGFSRLIFYTESEQLIDQLVAYFDSFDSVEKRLQIGKKIICFDSAEHFLEIRKKIIYGEKNIAVVWIFDKYFIKLENEKDTLLPMLIYYFTSH